MRGRKAQRDNADSPGSSRRNHRPRGEEQPSVSSRSESEVSTRFFASRGSPDTLLQQGDLFGVPGLADGHVYPSPERERLLLDRCLGRVLTSQNPRKQAARVLKFPCGGLGGVHEGGGAGLRRSHAATVQEHCLVRPSRGRHGTRSPGSEAIPLLGSRLRRRDDPPPSSQAEGRRPTGRASALARKRSGGSSVGPVRYFHQSWRKTRPPPGNPVAPHVRTVLAATGVCIDVENRL